MRTSPFLKTFSITLLTFLLLDALWLRFVAIDMFQREIGSILRTEPKLWAVGIFYLIYAAALTALAVLPSANASGAAARGALLGLAAYAAYDLTNLATINGWTIAIAAKDMTWGVFASAVASIAGYKTVTRRA